MLVTTDSAVKAAQTAIAVIDTNYQIVANYRETHGLHNDDTLEYEMKSALLNRDIDTHWRKDGRQILSIDPELAEVLGRTDGEIITETLLALPYRSPFISFPDPIQVGEDTKQGTTGHLIGAYVCGRDNGTGFTSTHEPGIANFMVLLIVEVRQAATQKPSDYDLLRITVPITRESTTIADVVTAARSRGRYAAFDGSPVTGVNTYIETMLSHALSAMFYLCSTTFDAEPIPARAVQKRWGTGKKIGKAPAVTKIGWHVGPAITKARREAAERTDNHTGITRAPHAVRAHFKTVWTGKGRTTPRVVFVAPYMTGTDSLDVPTIHTVK